MNRNTFFAAKLVQEIPFHKFNPNLPENKGYLFNNLPGEWEKALDKADSITQEAKARGLYFYLEGGSMFMDYKNLRESSSNRRDENYNRRFSPEATVPQIFTTAIQVIAEWKTAAARGERKG